MLECNDRKGYTAALSKDLYRDRGSVDMTGGKAQGDSFTRSGALHMSHVGGMRV
jgi:hypothetical protein